VHKLFPSLTDIHHAISSKRKLIVNLTLKGYSTLRKINESTNTLILAAVREKDNMPVILKTSAAEFPSEEENLRLLREHAILKRFSSRPNIIFCHGIESSSQRQFLVLEDLDGSDLMPFTTADNLLSLAEFLQISIEITVGIAEIHAQNLIHKDINPRNILIDRTHKTVKIIDFGLTTELSRESGELNVDGVWEGSLPYISPEQTGRVNRELDYHTDFYSLGATLYHLLTGRYVFTEHDALGFVYAHVAKKPDDPRLFNPAIPQVLANIVLKLLEKDIEDRYQSAHGIIADLKECLRRYNEFGTIDSFEIGRNDVSQKFELPQKLYGREKELSQLLEAFHRTAQGASEVVMVSGFSGIGKSVLINEVRKPLIERNGIFVKGKFDQFSKNIPYSGFIQAFQDILSYLMRLAEDDFNAYKDALTEKLGSNCAVITELMPEFSKILGPQPPFREATPVEMQNRNTNSILKFIDVFTAADHPLVIFLDDLQWIDLASAIILKELLLSNHHKHLLFIGSYRSNEITNAHPLTMTLADITAKRSVEQIYLKPLDEPALSRLIAAVVHRSENDTIELARAINKKVDGNPFYTGELLKTLYREKIITFDITRGAWVWDLHAVIGFSVFDDIVNFMLEKLKKLSPESQDMLHKAACIGSTFDIDALARINGSDLLKTYEKLKPAIDQGLIIPLSEKYKMLDTLIVQEQVNIDQLKTSFPLRFQHDKVQQAAYDLHTSEERIAIHLHIARHLMQNSTGGDESVAIARHYREAGNLITDQKERLLVARLNLKVASKLRRTNAYESAFEYSASGLKLLPGLATGEDPTLRYELQKEYCQSAYLSGRFEIAEEAMKHLVDLAPTKLDKVYALQMKSTQYTTMGKMEEAIQAGLEALNHLGIHITKNPHPLAIAREFLLSKIHLGSRPVASLIDHKIITDVETITKVRLLLETTNAAYLTGNENLTALAIMKATNVCLRQGNISETSYVYANYATIVGSFMGLFNLAKEYFNLALKLTDKYPDPLWKARTYMSYGLFGRLWHDKLAGIDEYFKTAIALAHDVGDYFTVAACASSITYSIPDLSLESYIQEQTKYVKLLEEINHLDLLETGRVILAAFISLSGKAAGPGSLTTSLYDEKKSLQQMIHTGHTTGYTGFYVSKLLANYWDGLFREAFDDTKRVLKTVKAIYGTVSYFEFSLYSALNAARIHPQLEGRDKRLALAILKKQSRNFRVWAAHNPQNFLHFHKLIEAQLAAIRKQPLLTVLTLYNEAIAAAKSFSYRYTALANELCALYLVQGGHEKLATSYFFEAAQNYELWGCPHRVAALMAAYPHQFEKFINLQAKFVKKEDTESLTRTRSRATTTTQARSAFEGSLDFATLMKTSLQLSSEVKLESLLKKLMVSLIENAGATKGSLILWREMEQDFYCEAIAESEQNFEFPGSQIFLENAIPENIIRFVIRSQSSLIIKDISEEGLYNKDSYFRKSSVKSLMATPISHRGKLVGVIYLENSNLIGAFTHSRVELIHLLSSQAAVSIENAHLYHDMEDRIRQRTSEIKSMLENINQGIFIIKDSTMNPREAYSRHLTQILDLDSIENLNVLRYLLEHSTLNQDEQSQILTAVTLALDTNAITFELNKHVLPYEMVFGGKFLEIDWHPILNDVNTVEKMLVTLRDVTEIKKLRDEAEAQRREMYFIQELVNQEAGKIDDFFAETAKRLAQCKQALAQSDLTKHQLLRILFIHIHTIKGISRTMRLKELNTRLHEFEQLLVKERDSLTDKCDLSILTVEMQGVQTLVDEYKRVYHVKLKNHVQLGSDTYSGIAQQFQKIILNYSKNHPERMSAAELKEVLDAIITPIEPIVFPPLHTALRDTIASLEYLARDLNKQPPSIEIDDSGYGFTKEGAALLQSVLVHLFRNSLDHGIEPPSVREQSRKKPQGCIRISLHEQDEKLVLLYRDDGKGLDLKAIYQKALEAGHIRANQHLDAAEIAELIFMPHLSTAEKVTDISGRGVGMDAVKNLLREAGGDITLSRDNQPPGSQTWQAAFMITLPATFYIKNSHMLPRAA
jgi:predicted ATPase/GAF domain-containing protein/HPt (histidine-containing phosphotransfer) domain-containing protein